MSTALFNRAKPHLGPVADPPNVFNLELVMTQVADVLTMGSIEFDGSFDSEYKLIVYVTPSVGFGITKPKSAMFKLITAMTPVVSPSVNDFTSKYDSRLSVPDIGDKIFCRIAAINTVSGQRFELGQANVIVN